MEPDLLREIGQECYTGFKDDEDSRKEWLDRHTFWLSLYAQQDYAENSDSDRDWGATESIPILTEACNQFQARTYKAFFSQDLFISAVPIQKGKKNRKELEARAKRIGDHMSYQLGYLDPAYKQDKDALFLGTPLHGSFFTKTFFNGKIKRFDVDNIRPTDLVINYNVGPIRIEDVRRKSHVIYTTIGDTEEMVERGYLLSEAKSCQHLGKQIYNVKVDETVGITEPNYSLRRDRPATLIEQHVYLDIDGKGFRPYIVTFDLADHSVKRLTIGWDADDMGNPTNDYEQVQYFTHYKYRENPDGFYGLGLGNDVGDINSACNIILRQSLDAATLSNHGNSSGFISERLGLEGDEISMVLGKFIKIPDTLGDMTNSIMQMKFPGPNEVGLKIMQELDLRAQRMTSTTEATTGTLDKVVQPTTYLTQVEQALEPLSSVQMRLANSMTEELQKIKRINAKYLPVVEYYMVNDVPEIITRADYADDMLVRPIFDPKSSTQGQKIARSQAIAQVVMANPLTAQRPQAMDAVTRRQLEAMDVDNIQEFVPNADPIRMDNPLEENMQFLMPPGQGQSVDAFPEQDHAVHILAHQSLLQEKGAAMLPEQVQAVLLHIMKHEALFYGQQYGVIPAPQQIGDAALAAGQDDQMGIDPLGGAIQAPPQVSAPQGY